MSSTRIARVDVAIADDPRLRVASKAAALRRRRCANHAVPSWNLRQLDVLLAECKSSSEIPRVRH